ncbi:MAG: hypothetical protein M0P13_10140 [Fibrobacteraceae bacterium]|nr:hypothetical protein [Fibrobacteraceae bacterium]
MKDKILEYIKSLHWKFLFIAAAFCIGLAIVNNLRVTEEKSVAWLGTQDVLTKPGE